MSSSQQELQSNVEKIVESYLKKSARSLQRQRQSLPIMEEQKDITQEIIEKEFQKEKLLEILLKQITMIIEQHFLKHRTEIDNQLLHLEQEILNLKQKQITFPSQESTIKQTLVLSKNSSFTDLQDQSFILDDQAKILKGKIKQLKEQMNKKTQYQDTLINMVLEQQKDQKDIQKRHQCSIDIELLSKQLYDQIWKKIDYQNKEYAETKFFQFKSIVEQNQAKQKEKEQIIWTIVNNCKDEVDNVTKQINDLQQAFIKGKDMQGHDQNNWSILHFFKKQ